MSAHHSGAGIAHDIFDLLAHVAAIAMNGTFITCRLILPEWALIKPLVGILAQFCAAGAQLRSFPMKVSAVKTDHGLNRLPLSGDSRSEHSLRIARVKRDTGALAKI